MHHFPGRQIWKCMTTLAWQRRHLPSINQICDTHIHTHTQNHTSCQCRNMQKECHVIYYLIYSRERQRNGLRAEELSMTPHQTCLQIRWRLGLCPKPLFSPFLFIWSSLDVCKMSNRILLRLWGQMGTGATIMGDGGEEIWTGGWRWRRNRRSWQNASGSSVGDNLTLEWAVISF